MDWLLEYEKVISLFINVMFYTATIFIGYKGLSTFQEQIKKHSRIRKIDLSIEHSLNLKTEAFHQFHKLISLVTTVHSSFCRFSDNFTNFNSELNDIEQLYNLLNDLLLLLDGLGEVITQSYLVNDELMEKVRRYRFAVSEYSHKYCEILKYVTSNNKLLKGPDIKIEDIDLDDPRLKETHIFYGSPQEMVYKWYGIIEREIHGKDVNSFIKDTYIEGDDDNGN